MNTTSGRHSAFSALLLILCKALFTIHCSLFTTVASAQQTNDYYFYSTDDIQRLKIAAGTLWGKEIVDNFQRVVEERLKHPMEVPLLEGGHIHHYFCPVHNTQFVFDWDSPKAHYCTACNKKWSGEDYYDWAWVNFVHGENLKYLMANMYLYLATGEESHAQRIKQLLLDLSAKYPNYIEHDRERKSPPRYCGKMFSQSLDESVWAIDAARAYSVAAAVMTAEERAHIETGFLEPCARLLMKQADKGNWQVWHNGALIALGIALRNDSIIDQALNKPDIGYHALMERNVYDDGWWNEGSVVYHFYPLRSLVLSAEALRCRNINLYEGKLHKMFISPVNLLYPDLAFPSQNDGWYGISLVAQANLYELAALRYNDPVLTRLLALCYQQVERNSPEALINGKELGTRKQQPDLKSHAFPNLGVAVLRSNGRTVVAKYGPDGGIHGHPDKLSISIHNGKRELLPDLGTTAYGVPDCTAWYQKTFSHNTVTVDETSQLKSTGQLIRFQPTKHGGTVEAEANDAYKGVRMNRTLLLDKNNLKDRFLCQSEKEHVYDYVLVLTEPVDLGGQQDTSIIKKYDRISNVKSKRMKGTFSFAVEGAVVNVQVKGAPEFDVITGVAPGIPPTGIAEGKAAYPLIVRVKGQQLDVKTNWTFDK